LEIQDYQEHVPADRGKIRRAGMTTSYRKAKRKPITTITNDSPLWQRHITVPVSSHTVGRAKDLRVTLTLVFSKTVRFRGVVSQGWDCGDLIPNSRVKSMTCTRIQSGPDIPSLVFKAQGFRPGATVNVDAADNADPNPANNSAVFRARYWSHL
ncbi:MAG TPA: hypothetical protein VFC57_02670, partial [Aeromicrobium sp.]|nr:hypothetical protein [Aeromicrobium sp.]